MASGSGGTAGSPNRGPSSAPRATCSTAIGVRYLADRARRELTASGEASERHHGTDALDQLTPQELQIARLAAEGLSNREIGSRLYLSHRTVGSHLYRAYPKLGITSRSQLHLALS
jgi:DNA-binding NarL/FixJ family response regulator